MLHKMYFYQTARGEKEIRRFLRDLPQKHRIKCTDCLNRVLQHGTRLPSSILKHLEGGLWEARPEYSGIEYRFFLFFYIRSRVGVVAAIVKKRQKIERKVIERALLRTEEMQSKWEENDREQVHRGESNPA